MTAAEKTFGPEHLNTAQSLNNLAFLYSDRGKYAEAEPLYKQSLAIREKDLGPNHPDVASVCENMAKCYRGLGREKEAKELEARARKIRSGR